LNDDELQLPAKSSGVAGLGGDVLHAAFTGKATLVMTCRARSLICPISEPTKPKGNSV